jgi:hypothetical protein
MEIPNPGSPEAVDLGCKCTAPQNHDGEYPPLGAQGWWLHPQRPVHYDPQTGRPRLHAD